MEVTTSERERERRMWEDNIKRYFKTLINVMFSTSLYWYIMGPIRDSVIEINSLNKHLNRKFTKKTMNDVYIDYYWLICQLPSLYTSLSQDI